MEVPGKFHGTFLEELWKFHGNFMEGSWNFHVSSVYDFGMYPRIQSRADSAEQIKDVSASPATCA